MRLVPGWHNAGRASASQVLRSAVICYLGLAAVEGVRRVVVEPPYSYSAGFYGDERRPGADGPQVFRWTRGEDGDLLRPIRGSVLRVPLYLPHPAPPSDGWPVRLLIDGRFLDEIVIRSSGWTEHSYYLPAFLTGFEVMPSPAPSEHVSYPDFLQTLVGWRRRVPRSLWLRVETAKSFVPAEVSSTSDDHRLLGVAVGEPVWSSEIPADGIGFYELEQTVTRRYRWARRRASMAIPPAPAAGRELEFQLRIPDEPLPGRQVRVKLLWNDRVLRALSLDSSRWHGVILEPPEPSAGGVLTLVTDRALTPSTGERRSLAAAVTSPIWR